MPVPARMPYTYGEVDSEALPASERFVLWRETGRLPMAAEPPDHDSRRRFHICVYKSSGPSGHFADLVATPMKFSRTKDHYNRDGLNMISLTLMLGPDVQYQFGTAGRSVVTRDPEGKGRIGDIAYRCGFEDPVHFTRLFRQRFGLTPSALRASGAVLEY